MTCTYLQLSTQPHRAEALGQTLADLRSASPGGAEITAAFAPQIGLSLNTLPVLLRGTSADLAARVATLTGLDGVTGHQAWDLTAVSERALGALRPAGGIYTNRWFHVRADRTAAFEDDTLTAWDSFETRTGAEVVGLWKTPVKSGTEGDVVSYLLIARYDDLAAWDRSRFFNRADDARDADWMAKFQRRREMMVDSMVVTTRCLFGPDQG